MHRLFTGIELPYDLSQQLALLKGSLFPARWISPSDFHITLRFIGDVSDYIANDLHMLFEQSIRKPFAVTLEQLDVFGGDRPRALIVRVGLNDALRELQQEHERICRRLGLSAEPRKYTPHITLARLKDVSPLDTADWLAQKGVFHRQTFRVDHVTLFSSQASTGGGPYVVEARYPLRDTVSLTT